MKVAKQYAEYLMREHVITAEEAEVQEYALFLLVHNVAFHGCLLLLAAWFGVFGETILFEAIFLPLRSYLGGYHASTPGRCFGMSIGVWALLMLLCRVLPAAIWPVVLAAGVALAWKKAPIPHPNNPISAERFAQVRRISRMLLLFSIAAAVLCAWLLSPEWALVVAVTVLTVACSLMAAERQ